MLKPIDELKVRITSSTTLPDPAQIDSTGDWYYLDHVSSGLVSFDSEQKKFVPLLAESWSTRADGTHVFHLRPGIRFHDGTPITAKDVLWTIKRQLLLKTSTHFRFWEYIVGCESLQSLEEECAGLKAVSEHEIVIHLKVQTDSFFLQMASPETAIWAAGDMDAKTGKLTATKFSGPYFLASRDDDSALLRRNEVSLISQNFPGSPRSIRILKIPLSRLNDALLDRKVDLAVRSYRPFGEKEWQEAKVRVRSTTPSTIIYLYGTGRGNERPLVGSDFLKAAWSINKDRTITEASTYLPFVENYSLSKTEFMAELSQKTSPLLRVLCPEGFFASEFTNALQEAAHAVGSKIEFAYASQAEWFAAFEDPSSSEKYDYILSSYAASERYPSIQLRYITGSLPVPPIDLKRTESPELNVDRVQLLKDYQKWLLRSRQAIPLFFNVTLFLHQEDIELGAQPSSDAEIELWRVQKRNES